MWFSKMFDEVPLDVSRDAAGEKQLRDFDSLVQLLNRLLTRAPEFNCTWMVGTPINAVLDYPMATEGGFAAFLDDKVNQKLKAILNQWGAFLKTEESAYVLSTAPNGWFGPKARRFFYRISPRDSALTHRRAPARAARLWR